MSGKKLLFLLILTVLLPVDKNERAEAKADCKQVMEAISDIYKQADKGTSWNANLSDEAIGQMQDTVEKAGCPVTTVLPYSNMENYKAAEDFLMACMAGDEGSIIIYTIHKDGGISRNKYTFDGQDMYVLTARTMWNEAGKPEVAHISYNKIKEWEYTDKGWFGYELQVPEPPEVTEIINGSYMIRVKPMKDTYRKISEKCVLNLGYQGNNLLCSNWDGEHLEDLDYNGMYEYLYEIKYQKKFPAKEYPNGIPKAEFESLIMEYLPVDREQIREGAVFDEEHQAYAWAGLGYMNYSPTFFATSLPEITHVKENADGTTTLRIDAVCAMVIYDDAVITHELTVHFAEDGSFKYLGNKILKDGVRDIPEYQYRLKQKV